MTVYPMTTRPTERPNTFTKSTPIFSADAKVRWGHSSPFSSSRTVSAVPSVL